MIVFLLVETAGCFSKTRNFVMIYTPSESFCTPDFARRFFVNCAQISEAYAVRTLMKFGCNWRKIGRKGKCRKDSESTYLYNGVDAMETKNIILELLLHEKGLSQEELAQKVAVTRQAVSRWENGETVPNTETLKLLSKEFDVSINTLRCSKAACLPVLRECH